MKHRVSIPILILCAATVHSLIAFVTWAAWWTTDDFRWVALFFQYQDRLFMTLFAATSCGLSLVAWRRFARTDALKQAWLLITLALLCRLIGSILKNLLGVEPGNQALTSLFASISRETAEACYQVGKLFGGPLHLLLLVGGLHFVLRVYRQLELLARLRAVDYALFSIVLMYTGMFLYHVQEWWQQTNEPVEALKMLNWIADPLLSVLLLQVIFLRRSVVNMGWSLIAGCWGAFTAAVFFTSMGDLGLWATWQGYLPWPINSVTWYVWIFSSTAYVLGPAWQVEALLLATRNTPRISHEDFAAVARS